MNGPTTPRESWPPPQGAYLPPQLTLQRGVGAALHAEVDSVVEIGAGLRWRVGQQ